MKEKSMYYRLLATFYIVSTPALQAMKPFVTITRDARLKREYMTTHPTTTTSTVLGMLIHDMIAVSGISHRQEKIRELLSVGANPNQELVLSPEIKITPLEAIVASEADIPERADIARDLLDAGAVTDKFFSKKSNLLHGTALMCHLEGNLAIAQELVKRGVSPTQKDSEEDMTLTNDILGFGRTKNMRCVEMIQFLEMLTPGGFDSFRHKYSKS